MDSGSFNFLSGAGGRNMGFPDVSLHQSDCSSDELVLFKPAFPETYAAYSSLSMHGPVLPASAGCLRWLKEAHELKSSAGFHADDGGGLTPPAWGAQAPVVDGGNVGGYLPDRWWKTQPQQLHGYAADQGFPPALDASMGGLFEQPCSAAAWPPMSDGGVDQLGLSTAAPPLVAEDMAYPFAAGTEGVMAPYPTMEVVSPYEDPARAVLCPSTPFTFAQTCSALETPVSTSLSDVSDMSPEFACGVPLADAAGLGRLAPLPAPSGGEAAGKTGFHPASSPPARAREPNRGASGPGAERSRFFDGPACRTRRAVRLTSRARAQSSPSPAWSSPAPPPSPPRPAKDGRKPDKEASEAAGPPYAKIDAMDPQSRHVLEATLLRDRDPGRARRVPYSVIMSKVRHLFSGAEETLRGHHRRLVKPKDQRVRRPVWEPRDIYLLEQAVVRQQRETPSGKISWTGVSEYIQGNGGSYKFGITTCSRKWRELLAGRRK